MFHCLPSNITQCAISTFGSEWKLEQSNWATDGENISSFQRWHFLCEPLLVGEENTRKKQNELSNESRCANIHKRSLGCFSYRKETHIPAASWHTSNTVPLKRENLLTFVYNFFPAIYFANFHVFSFICTAFRPTANTTMCQYTLSHVHVRLFALFSIWLFVKLSPFASILSTCYSRVCS